MLPVTLSLDPTVSLFDFQVGSLSGLPIQNSALTPSVCSINQNKLTFLGLGKCEVLSLAVGNDEWAETSLTTTFTKVSQRRSVTCVKGKLTKKISGVTPKCPAGYKKKA